jgi:hypothetical protein
MAIGPDDSIYLVDSGAVSHDLAPMVCLASLESEKVAMDSSRPYFGRGRPIGDKVLRLPIKNSRIQV